MTYTILIFVASCALLFGSGKILIESLSRMARYLEWKEFVVAFILVAIAASIPNLFVGITSALHGVPELSFGDIVGGNLVDLTLAVALAALFAKGKLTGLPAQSRMVQSSAVFTMFIALLPLILILDNSLGRIDGAILIAAFIFYVRWLFSSKERFSKVYDGKKETVFSGFWEFVRDLGIVVVGLVLLLVAANGIVYSAQSFSVLLSLPLALVGILIVGVGNAIPETYFAILAARRGQNWLILGDLMGAVIVASTLVLGTVALISPIEDCDLSPFAIARFFLFIAAVFFLFFVKTEQRISKMEALFLLGVFLAFVAVEIAKSQELFAFFSNL